MKQYKISLLASVVAVLLMGFTGTVGATETVRVSQRIRPLQCTVSAVQSGNTITYTYSLGCGGRQPYTEVIQPKPSMPPPVLPNPTGGELPPHSSGGGTTFLNQNDAIFGTWGMPLIAHEGATYLFYLPGEKPHKPTRSIYIKQITADGVLFIIEPGGLHKGVRVGDSFLLDLNNDSAPDIRIIVEYVNKNQGVASLRVFLYGDRVQPDTAIESLPVQIMGLASILLLVGAVHIYYRGKHPHLHIHWKAPHKY